MASIRSEDTTIEVMLRKGLWGKGIRGFRLHGNLPGKPDIVFSKSRVVVFIDGDFWHGYNWFELKKIPPRGYWRVKIRRNALRDKYHNKVLCKMGWKVIRIWEHELYESLPKCLARIEMALSP